jgi:hypothetical protein
MGLALNCTLNFFLNDSISGLAPGSLPFSFQTTVTDRRTSSAYIPR